MLNISRNISIPETEIELSSIRAQGAGGQNVNKVSSAIHLRFDITASSLPEFYQQRLLKLSDSRISKDGVVVIKAQSHRTREKNREEALARLQALIRSVTVVRKQRVATRPSRAAKTRRMDEKSKRGKHKELRRKVIVTD